MRCHTHARVRTWRSIATRACLAAFAGCDCGDGDQPRRHEPATDTATQPASPARGQRRAAPRGCCASAASTRPPTSPPRAATAPLRGRARGHDPRGEWRARARRRRSSTSAAASPPAARAGLLRWPSRRDYASSRRFYVYYTDRRLHPDRPVPPLGGEPEPRRPGCAAGDPRSAPPLQPQRRPAAVRPGRLLYAGLRRRRRGRRPGHNGQNLSACSASSSGSPRGRAAATRSRATTRSRNRAGARPEIYAYGLRNP